MKVFVSIILYLSAIVAFGQFGLPTGESEPVKARLILPTPTVQAGDSIEVGVAFDLAEHWHIYWKNPGATGLPTTLNWTLPEGYELGKLHWPAPIRFATPIAPGTPPLVSFGYDGKAVLIQEIKVPDNAASPAELKVKASWLACKEACIPGKEELTATLTIGGETRTDTAATAELAEARKQLPEEGDGRFSAEIEERNLVIMPKLDAEVKQMTFFPLSKGVVDITKDQMYIDGRLGVPLLKSNVQNLNGIIVTDTVSYSVTLLQTDEQQKGEAAAPTEPSEGRTDADAIFAGFTIERTTGGLLDAQEMLAFLEDREKGLFTDKSLFVVILIIIVGGIGLNLTPCVLPMIPINLAIIGAGSKAESKSAGLVRGLTYGAGMALAYGVLGLVTVLTGAKFGTLNSASWFNFAIAAIFILLSLAMFDVFSIDFSKYTNKFGPKDARTGKFLPIFILGIVTALLAGACVAPVVIAVLLHSSTLYAEGNYFGLLLPFLLGISMALPWPLAGAGFSVLPKPGQWMVWVKKAFGVLILLTALYYGYQGYRLLPAKSAAENTAGNAIATLQAGLAEAKRTNKPVFIDFWATWCKNCITMEHTTFEDPEVKEKLKDYVVIKFQAEKPNSEEIAPILEKFDIKGLPAFAIVSPEEE